MNRNQEPTGKGQHTRRAGTQQLPETERYVCRSEYVLDCLVVMMGGRAAEQLVLSTVTSATGNDLKQANQLARKMVLDWGMSDHLEHLAFGGECQHVFLGEEIALRRSSAR